MYQRPDAPLSIGGVLDDGFSLLKASFMLVFPLATVGAFVGQLPNLMLDQEAIAAQTFTTSFFVVIVLSMAVSLFVFGVLVSRVNALTQGIDQSLGEALGVAAQRIVPLIVAAILYSLALMFGLVLLLVPGIIFGLTLAFGPYLVVTERMGPIQALKHSHNLVWGNWWRTAALFSVMLFVLLTAYVLIGVFAGVSAAGGSIDVGSIFTTVQYVVTPILTGLITPIVYALSIAILNDLILRKEGGDIAERLDALDTV